MLEQEIKNVVGVDHLAELQKEMINKVIEEDSGIIQCACGNAIEVLKGEIDYNVKKEDGSGITKTAAKHMAQFRIRCNECEKNFCKSCKVEPYHIGFNCAQYQKNKNQRKCKFCGCNVRG